GEDVTAEALERLEHRAAVEEDRRLLGHAGHQWMRGIGGDLEERAAGEELRPPHVRGDVLHGQLELRDGEIAAAVHADQRAALLDELIEGLDALRAHAALERRRPGAAPTAVA